MPTAPHRIAIATTWNGDPLEKGERATLEVCFDDPVLVRVEAGDHGDPEPAAPPGRLDGLWNHEVVELFLLGDAEHYLEIELGPHGHWLGLRLEGRRQVVDDRVPIDHRVHSRGGGRWTGEARFAARWLPPGLRAWNAFAIHGAGEGRRYLAASPVPGDGPDFHRLEAFAPLSLPR